MLKSRALIDTILTFIKQNPEVLTYGIDVETNTWMDRREIKGIKIDNITNKIVLVEGFKQIPTRNTPNNSPASNFDVAH